MVPLYSFLLVEISLQSQVSQGWTKWWWLENPICRGWRQPSVDKGAGLGCWRETAESLDLFVAHPCALPLHLILLWAKGWTPKVICMILWCHDHLSHNHCLWEYSYIATFARKVKLNLNKLFHCCLAQLVLNNFEFTVDNNTDKDSSPFSTDNHAKLSEVVLYLNLACPHKFKMPDLMCIETIARLAFTWLEIELCSTQVKSARLNFQM